MTDCWGPARRPPLGVGPGRSQTAAGEQPASYHPGAAGAKMAAQWQQRGPGQRRREQVSRRAAFKLAGRTGTGRWNARGRRRRGPAGAASGCLTSAGLTSCTRSSHQPKATSVRTRTRTSLRLDHPLRLALRSSLDNSESSGLTALAWIRPTLAAPVGVPHLG